jgi:hypothetical protein
MKFCLKLCGLIVSLDMVLLKLLLLSLCMVKRHAYSLARQNDLSAIDYHGLMMDNMDEDTDKWLEALKAIEKDKARVSRAYNKKVRKKEFQVGDLVWNTILPLGVENNKFGKWSPSWEGPFKVVKVIAGNSCMVESPHGTRLPRALNGRNLMY